MEIVVETKGPDGSYFREPHIGEWVEHDTCNGELRITIRDRDNRIVGWTVYAAGYWRRVAQTKPVAEDVRRHMAAAAERDRAPAAPNGGKGFNPPGGNSGPV